MQRGSSAFAFAASISVVVSSFACSSSDTKSPTATAAPDGGGDAPGDFAVYVVAPKSTLPFDPIEGAVGLLDLSNGARIEAKSDATGRIVFPGVSFRDGPATLTVFASGRTMSSFVGISPDVISRYGFPRPAFPAGGRDFVTGLPLVEQTRDDVVKLDVTVSGKLADGNRLIVTTSSGVDIADVATSAFRIDVRKDVPSTMVVAEATLANQTTHSYEETKLRWRSIDVPARSEGGPFALDLSAATELVPVPVNVTLVAPPDATLTAPPTWQVQGEEGSFYFVLGSRSNVTASVAPNTFASSGEYVTLPALAEMPKTYAWFVGESGEVAVVQHRGLPVAGEQLEALPFPKPLGAVAVGEEIPLAGLDPSVQGAALEIIEQRVQRQLLVWSIQTFGATLPSALKVPDLPEAARALLPAEPRARLVTVKGTYDASLPFAPTHTAFSRFFDVTK